MFQMAIAMVLNSTGVETDKQAVKEFLENQIAQIDKKVENKKPKKTQQENELIKQSLYGALSEEGQTITQIQANGFDQYSNQKLSALLNQLVKEGNVEKEVGKDRKTMFKLVANKE